MNQKISLTVIAVAAMAAVLVAFIGVSNYKNLEQTKIANEARFQCTQSSRYQTEDAQKNVIWYPVAELYQKCLQEKGL